MQLQYELNCRTFYGKTIYYGKNLIWTAKEGNVCDIVYCGQGTCEPSNDLFGFTCNCDPGWKKFDLAYFQFPPCILPNCSVDLNCGNGSAPTPSPFIEGVRLGLNLSDPCELNMCGDGKCVKLNGTDFTCQCNEGSKNLMGNPKFSCLKKCALGPNCDVFNKLLAPSPSFIFESPPVAPPLPPSPIPPTSTSTSTSTSPGEKLKCSRIFLLIILITTFISLIDFSIKTFPFFS